MPEVVREHPVGIGPPGRAGAETVVSAQDEAGQVTVLALAALGLVVAVLLGLAQLGRGLVLAAQAHAAADAAALAAVVGGPAAAASVAADNGAALVATTSEPGWARVTVSRAGRRATSTAALVGANPPVSARFGGAGS